MKREITEVASGKLELICGHEVEAEGTIGDSIVCKQCEDLVFPENMECYKSTPEFTDETVPNGLRKDHYARRGVWAKVVVSSGRMKYIITEPVRQEFILEPGCDGIVSPEQLHYVETPEACRFQVNFYRKKESLSSPEVPSTALD